MLMGFEFNYLHNIQLHISSERARVQNIFHHGTIKTCTIESSEQHLITQFTEACEECYEQ